uniref:Uncharacterized protein LOC109505276 n=1 Tax=Elaeis guineensis var. tenera TaxID=51953 RepID=A0A6J0PDJ2_ELAGV
MEELIDSLMTHELNMVQKEEEEESKKKKIIAFKSTIKFEDSDKSKDEDEEESEGENEDLGLLIRKFKKFLKKKWMKKKDDKEKKERNAICYKCNKSGHYKPDCPQLKKYPKKNKKMAMMSIWKGSDISLWMKKKRKK